MDNQRGNQHRHADPVYQRDKGLHDIVQRQRIRQNDQPDVHAGGQQQPAQHEAENGQREAAGPDRTVALDLYALHLSTALYPSPRTVLISNPSQEENLSRSFVI